MEFIVKKDENISKNVTNGTTVEFFSFQVPAKSRMTVTHFSNGLNTFDAWGYVTWIFKRNSVGFPPYEAIVDQVAFGAPLRRLEGIEIQGGDLFQIFVTNDHVDVVGVRIALKYEIIQEK